jgi:hypothetical protein
MSTQTTISLAHLDALCRALDDYLAMTLEDHYKHNSTLEVEFRSARERLMSVYTPVEVAVWRLKSATQIAVTTD